MSHIDWGNSPKEVVSILEKACTSKCSLPLAPVEIVAKSAAQIVLPKISPEDWRREQANDLDIGPVVDFVRKNEHLVYKATTLDSDGKRVLLRYKHNLSLHKGLLYRKVHLKSKEEPVFQFVLPKSYVPRTLYSLHDDMGHIGIDRTVSLIQERFFWPRMNGDVREHIHKCSRCT